jgi:hypothetical protein
MGVKVTRCGRDANAMGGHESDLASPSITHPVSIMIEDLWYKNAILTIFTSRVISIRMVTVPGISKDCHGGWIISMRWEWIPSG